MQETGVPSLRWEDPLEKGKATHPSIVAWRIRGHKESDTTKQLSLNHASKISLAVARWPPLRSTVWVTHKWPQKERQSCGGLGGRETRPHAGSSTSLRERPPPLWPVTTTRWRSEDTLALLQPVGQRSSTALPRLKIKASTGLQAFPGPWGGNLFSGLPQLPEAAPGPRLTLSVHFQNPQCLVKSISSCHLSASRAHCPPSYVKWTLVISPGPPRSSHHGKVSRSADLFYLHP